MKIPFSAVALCVLFVCASVSCQPKSQPKSIKSEKAVNIDYGTVDRNVHTNKTLGFKLKLPESMVVDSREELDAGLKEGIALLKQGNSNHAEAVNKMAQQERIIFGLNTPESETAGIMNISVIAGSGNGEFKDMVARTLQVFVESTKSNIVKPIADEIIGGVNFITFITSMEVEGSQVYTKVHSFRRNDHLISVSISYAEERGFKPMQSVLNSIEFF